MRKISKIIITMCILIFASFSLCNYAFATNTSAESTSQTSGEITTTVSSKSSADNELLSPTNIINILLIAVGIVIILLAIAIFTRLKK